LTWILVLFLGFIPPLDYEGYKSEDACIRAGEHAVSKCPKDRACKYYCFMGAEK